MPKLKKIGATILILGGLSVTPIVPEQMDLVYSYQYQIGVEIPLTHIPASATSTEKFVPAYTLPKFKDDNGNGIISVSVFADRKGNKIEVQIPDKKYQEMSGEDGHAKNPTKKEYRSLFKSLTAPEKVSAAIAFDASPAAVGGAAAGTSLTWSHTTSGSDRILWSGLLIARAVSGAAPTSVTYNGVAMTQIASTVFSGGAGDIYMAYLAAPTTGANNITWNFSGIGNLGTTGFSTSFTGASQTGVPDSENLVSNMSGISSFDTPTTVVAANSWVVAVIVNNTSAITITSPATARVDNGTQIFADSNGDAAAGVYTINATNGSSNWSSIVASFAPATGGGGGSVTPGNFITFD